MKAIFAVGAVLGFAALFMAQAPADIVVLNNGQTMIGTVSFASSGRLKVTTSYGDQFFPRDQVAGYYLTPKGMEAEGYYQAGNVLLSKGYRDTARQLFERCVKYDASYRDKCNEALRGAGPPAATTSPAAAETAAPGTPAAGPGGPQPQTVRVPCPECSGTGVVMASSRFSEGSSRERPRPCPLCFGRGYRDLEIAQGYELCPDCGGFGATVGDSGGSDKGGFTTKKEMCPRCGGRGIVKAAFKSAEGTAGTGSSPMVVMSSSPAPGSSPPTGTYNIIKDRARDVASGRTPERPIGPSSITPVSPTIIENPPPAERSYERSAPSGEEVIVDEGATSSSDTGGSSDTGKTSEQTKSKKEESSESDYQYRGLVGKVNKYKWYIVLGGVALLVFAVVFSKMGGKK